MSFPIGSNPLAYLAQGPQMGGGGSPYGADPYGGMGALLGGGGGSPYGGDPFGGLGALLGGGGGSPYGADPFGGMGSISGYPGGGNPYSGPGGYPYGGPGGNPYGGGGDPFGGFGQVGQLMGTMVTLLTQALPLLQRLVMGGGQPQPGGYYPAKWAYQGQPQPAPLPILQPPPPSTGNNGLPGVLAGQEMPDQLAQLLQGFLNVA